MTGDGPLDLVFTHGTGIPIDLLSEDAGFIRFRKRLDTFSRTVWFEDRGMGASDGDPQGALAAEIAIADRIAGLDTVGFERPALVDVDAAAPWGRSISRSPNPSG